jgi:hypothetical protein
MICSGKGVQNVLYVLFILSYFPPLLSGCFNAFALSSSPHILSLT